MSPRLMESPSRVRRPTIASVVTTLTTSPDFTHTACKTASPKARPFAIPNQRCSYCATDLRRMTGLN